MVTLSSLQNGQDVARSIILTAEEAKTGLYDSPNLQSALEALHQDGFVVLKSVVDVKHADHLNQHMLKEAEDLIRDKIKPFNQGVECIRSMPQI